MLKPKLGLPGREYHVLWLAVPGLMLIPFGAFLAGSGFWHLDKLVYLEIQRDWFFELNNALSILPAGFWSNLTLAGDPSVLILLLSPIFYWRPQTLAATLCAAPIATVISLSGKSLIAMPRPAAILDPQNFTVIGSVLSGHNSLPSGHSFTVFTATIAILFTLHHRPGYKKDWLLLLACLVIAVVLCLSRVAVGAHWPLDLVVGGAGGWLAGLSGALIAQRFPALWSSGRARGRQYFLGAGLLIMSIFIVYRAVQTPVIEPALSLAIVCGITVSLWLLCKDLAFSPLKPEQTFE